MQIGRWAQGLSVLAVCSACEDRPQRTGMLDAASVIRDAAAAHDATLDAQTARPLALPVLPIGYAAFQQLARLPVLRIGQRALMLSTFDRNGGNEAVDASHYVRQERDDFNVTMDVAGPGVLAFVRTNHWHGSPWHYVVDGRDYTVTESSTRTPDSPVSPSVFLPTASFPSPLALTWSETRGADLSWISMPFRERLVLAYERTHYGTGYYIVQRHAEGAENLPELKSYALEAPPRDVQTLLSLTSEPVTPGPDSRVTRATVTPQRQTTLAVLDDGPRTIQALSLVAPITASEALAKARLRITWDDAAIPAVDAPLALFFGAGTFYRRDTRQDLVRSLFTRVHFEDDTLELDAYFPMPYRHAARIELISDVALPALQFAVRSEVCADRPEWLAPFHASYADIPEPVRGQDMVLLDTTQAEGGGRDFCGSFIGMSWTFSDRAELSTLEGDPRFFFDDARSPQAQGTGTEEWGGGGDYWGGQTMTLPLVGHPAGALSILTAQNDKDLLQSAYRFLVSDAMPFGKNARITLEHGGTNESTEHYTSVVYWYGNDGACLVQSDQLDVGNLADEVAHAYSQEQGSEVETVTSRFPLGVDHVGNQEIYPAHEEDGRTMLGSTRFDVRIDPRNAGVLLRRTFDNTHADQAAIVELENDAGEFVPVGRWLASGSNQNVFSAPWSELGASEQTVQESNRRFREDEFLIAPRFTSGRSSLKLRLRYDGDPLPIVPGGGVPSGGFSELSWRVYSYVLPPPQ